MQTASLYIGTLSARTGHSIHAIRWYEAQGLMPGVARDGGGRRVYADGHVAWLQMMQRLRHTGMSIAEMRRYTSLVRQGKDTLAARQAMLQAHRERVERTITQWQQALALLDSKIHFYGQWQRTGKRPPPLQLSQTAQTKRRTPR